MTKKKLTEQHGAVVHRSKHRTRLRVPKGKFRDAKELHGVKKAIEQVDGVKSVEVNPSTGSVLVHHDEKHDILGDIGAAIEESAPGLLTCLVVPGAMEEAGAELLTRMFRKYWMTPRKEGTNGHGHDGNGGNGGGPRMQLSTIKEYASKVDKRRVKEVLPMAFIVGGVVKLVQEESLWANVPALALFYWGFDMYWKLNHDTQTEYIEEAVEEQADS